MAEDRTVDIARLSRAYRNLVLGVGAQLLVGIGGYLLISSIGDPTLALILSLAQLGATLVISVLLAVFAYRTAAALGSSVPLVWAIAMIFPWINLLVLLILSSRSTRACRAAGVPVGLLGPKDVAKERDRQAATFE